MNNNRLFVSVFAAVLTAAPGFINTAQASLIVNGNFDTPDVAGSFVTFNAAPAGFGWSMFSDGTPNNTATTGVLGVDVINTLWVGTGGTTNPDGIDQSLDIDRTSSIWQSFATTVGTTYVLEFSYSHNRFATSATGRVSVDGSGSLIAEDLVHNLLATAGNMNWVTFSRSFMADSDLTTLKFEGNIANNNLGFVVDNISVTAIPLPAAAYLFPAGLLAGVAWMRRRR